MGSFAYTCSVSGLPIHAGDNVRFMLLSSSPYTDGSLMCTMSGDWFPRTFPIKAKYNDYGSVKDVEEGLGPELWMDGFQIDLLSVGVGENTCHDIRTSKDMSFAHMLSALQEGRIKVRSDVGDERSRIKRVESLIGRKYKTPVGIPTMQRVRKLLEENGYAKGYLVDKLRYGHIRVRWDGLSGDYGKDLQKLKKVQKLFKDYATVLAAGKGMNKVDLRVFPLPNTPEYYGPGSSFKKEPLRVVQSMIREDVWQVLSGRSTEEDFGRSFANTEAHVKAAIELYKKFLDLVKKQPTKPTREFEDMSSEEKKKYFEYNRYKREIYDLQNNRDLVSYYLTKSEVPFTVGLGEHFELLVRKQLPVSTVLPVLKDMAEFVQVYKNLSMIRIPWRPGNSVGPQFGEWKAHADFHRRLAEISEKEVRKEKERRAE